MKNMTCFSSNVIEQFENNYDNMVKFNEVLLSASRRDYSEYSKDECDKIIRTQFDKILGINFKEATAMKRRQAWREHSKEIASLIEDVIVERMNSGWNEANARFMEYVDDKNIAYGDKNEFYVEDTSLLEVSKFAGNHHDIIRQAVKPGKSFSVETSWYVIKVYGDYEMFQTGKIDFAKMVDKMNRSIEQYRYAALYTAFMGLDEQVPTELKLDVTLSSTTVSQVVDTIEAVKAASGRDVVLVGSRTAIQKLQGTVSYDIYSESMKDEKHSKGILAVWEGYDCLALDRVNKTGTLESVFSAEDAKKIFIMPVDPDNKPIKRVNEGDVIYNEVGMDGSTMDMTGTVDIRYQEGIAVVVSTKFGLIVAN